MKEFAVKDAKSFLLALKESTTTEYDDDAVEFLQATVDAIRHGLTSLGIADPNLREEWLFFDGLLKGTQLQLRKSAYLASPAAKEPN